MHEDKPLGNVFFLKFFSLEMNLYHSFYSVILFAPRIYLLQ